MGNFDIKVYDMGSGVDLVKIKAALGDLFAGSRPYGDASQTTLVAIKRDDRATIKEAVRRINGLGYETDEDD